MNDLTKKLISIGLCGALCLGGAGAVFAQTTDDQPQTEPASRQAAAVASPAAPAATKDETVYVLTDASGAVQKTIVSDWLCNAQGSSTLTDISHLSDIENVKGEETYTETGDGQLLWQAQGSDIYYQGTTEDAPPVTLRITYTLDGKAITPEELAGKSGQVVIRFDYEADQTVTVDGQTVPVPFAAVTALTLDTDTFRNVAITHGQLVNDGSRTVAVGLAFPGLTQALELGAEAALPDYVELSAEVTEFELGMTVTVATNQIFQQQGDGDSAAQLLTQLCDGITQLTDGSDALYQGLTTLLEQSAALTSGVDQLQSGAATLQTGAASAESGASQLATGLTELSTGLSTVSASSDSLNAGASQVFESLLASATTQLQAAGLSVPALTAENYVQTLSAVISQLSEGSAAAQTVTALKTSLDSYAAFYEGLRTYTGGVDSAAAGAATLATGASSLQAGTVQLRTGSATLASGLTTLQGQLPALIDGIQQLQAGSRELAEGFQQLLGQTGQTLSEVLGSDPAAFSTRLNATLEAAEQYRSFTGLADGTEGQVKFIYRTDEIKMK